MGIVDNISAVVEYLATRGVLSGPAPDAILKPENLYRSIQNDSSMNVFYLDQRRIKWKCEKHHLLNRWKRVKLEGVKFLSHVIRIRVTLIAILF